MRADQQLKAGFIFGMSVAKHAMAESIETGKSQHECTTDTLQAIADGDLTLLPSGAEVGAVRLGGAEAAECLRVLRETERQNAVAILAMLTKGDN